MEAGILREERISSCVSGQCRLPSGDLLHLGIRCWLEANENADAAEEYGEKPHSRR